MMISSHRSLFAEHVAPVATTGLINVHSDKLLNLKKVLWLKIPPVLLHNQIGTLHLIFEEELQILVPSFRKLVQEMMRPRFGLLMLTKTQPSTILMNYSLLLDLSQEYFLEERNLLTNPKASHSLTSSKKSMLKELWQIYKALDFNRLSSIWSGLNPVGLNKQLRNAIEFPLSTEFSIHTQY